uniref:N-acetyltransferase domain-containing protein n=1 Tax=Globodera pallida TaxID=36090 RepID=A0A183BJY9_GLOPA
MTSITSVPCQKTFATVTLCNQQQQANIRRMHADDVKHIAHATERDRMQMRNPEPELAQRAIRFYLGESESVLFVAESDGKKDGLPQLVACCRLKLCNNGNTMNGGRFAQIGPFATKIGLQRSGIGTAMLREAEEYARTQWGVSEMQLEVHGVKQPVAESDVAPPMTPQLQFYANRCYRRVGKVRHYNPVDANLVIVPSHLAIPRIDDPLKTIKFAVKTEETQLDEVDYFDELWQNNGKAPKITQPNMKDPLNTIKFEIKTEETDEEECSEEEEELNSNCQDDKILKKLKIYKKAKQSNPNKFGINSKTLLRWKKQCGYKSKQINSYKPDEKFEIIRQYKELIKGKDSTLHDYELAKKLNIHRTTLMRWKSEFGLNSRKLYSDEDKKKILQKRSLKNWKTEFGNRQTFEHENSGSNQDDAISFHDEDTSKEEVLAASGPKPICPNPTPAKSVSNPCTS